MVKFFYIFIGFVFIGHLGANAQENPKATVIYWDASFSMHSRDLNKEFQFLDAYFKVNRDIPVKLVVFNNKPILEIEAFIFDGEWSSLRQELLNVTYEGATSYSGLFNEENVEKYLLFSDGKSSVDDLIPKYGIAPVEVISSSREIDVPRLRTFARISSGRYHDLLNNSIAKVSPNIASVSEEKELKKVSGTVTDGELPLNKVSIWVKGTNNGTLTDNTGRFTIIASEQDILVFNYLGKQSQEVIIDDISDEISIELLPKVRQLENVTVSQERTEELVNTSYGKMDRNAVGYAVTTVESKDFNNNTGEISNAVRGKFAGVRMGKDGLAKSIIRGFNTFGNNYPIIILDGIQLLRASRSDWGEGLNFINPDKVKSITVLRGLAATNRYGVEGVNGVILISTVEQTELTAGTKESYNYAMLRENFFDGDLLVSDRTVKTSYIVELQKASSIREAYGLYLKQRLGFLSNPYYFVDVYDLFKTTNQQIAVQILGNAIEIAPDNLDILSVAAFKYEEAKNHQEAIRLYERIISLDPNSIQPYRDLAAAYESAGLPEKALLVYKDLISSQKLIPVNDGVEDVVKSEVRNLIGRYNLKDKTMDLPGTYHNFPKYDARIVFEWNYPYSQFDLEFVTPEKRISTWPHTEKEVSNRFSDELERGYSCQEFFLIDAEKGDWFIKVRNKSKKNAVPMFIRCSVYMDYGRPTQSKQEYIVRISGEDKEVTMASLAIN